jgi:hypothetical protein
VNIVRKKGRIIQEISKDLWYNQTENKKLNLHPYEKMHKKESEKPV